MHLGAAREPDRAPVETHLSIVSFDGEFVRKRKRPVRFDFVDQSTPELRLKACHNEVALNRRLAPDVYLGVEEERDNAGQLLDATVLMRRLPPERSLSALMASGADVRHELSLIAHRLAAFHSTALRRPEVDAVATPKNLSLRWDRDLAEWEPLLHKHLDIDSLAHERAVVNRFLDGRRLLLNQRIDGSHIVDGHGDILADDIFCLEDGPRIIDCLEFDPLLRYGDTMADIAFLAMDLQALGRPDLAAEFVALYRNYSGDHAPESLLHFYIAQRAMVRSKVALLRVQAGDDESRHTALWLRQLCGYHLEMARSMMIVIGGAPGTGKTTLAAQLADARGWVHLSSDRVRRDVAGVGCGASRRRDALDKGIHAPAVRSQTYAEMLARARQLLYHGESVVLDATFATGRWRAAARRLALETSTDLLEFCCHAPVAVTAGRVQMRQQIGGDLSDVDVALAHRLRVRRQPWPEAHALNTTAPKAALLSHCLHLLHQTAVGSSRLHWVR